MTNRYIGCIIALMSASLGGLLKDYRLQKNISQMEIAFALGWKEPSRLSRIEQGRVGNPPRKTLDKIIKAMSLKEEEKNHLLLIGSYLPAKEEIEKVRKLINPTIENWPYPITVYDFSWRVVHENSINTKIFRSSNKQAEWIKKKIPTIMEIQFADESIQSKHIKGKEKEIWHKFLIKAISQYKYKQQTRTKDKWFIELIKKMMNNELFRELWQQAKEPEDQPLFKEYHRIRAPHPESKNKMLVFDLFRISLVADPRFEIEFHTPADIETFKYFNKKK